MAAKIAARLSVEDSGLYPRMARATTHLKDLASRVGQTIMALFRELPAYARTGWTTAREFVVTKWHSIPEQYRPFVAVAAGIAAGIALGRSLFKPEAPTKDKPIKVKTPPTQLPSSTGETSGTSSSK